MAALLAPDHFEHWSLGLVADRTEHAKKIAQYRRLLGIADWYHEHADNHDAWKAGRAQFDALYELQELLDPMGEIWRSVAPAGLSVAVPQPRVGGAS